MPQHTTAQHSIDFSFMSRILGFWLANFGREAELYLCFLVIFQEVPLIFVGGGRHQHAIALWIELIATIFIRKNASISLNTNISLQVQRLFGGVAIQ